LNQNKKADALTFITEAQQYWRNIVTVTDEHIQRSYLAITDDYFHWNNFQVEVDAEIDLVKNQ
jgi:hypothetical protein